MFKRSLFIALVFINVMARADDGQKVASKVQKVIVFLKGAQVTRTADVNISAGTSTLVFENLSPEIDPQSIQVHANGDFTILSVKSEIDYLNSAVKQKNIEGLQAQQKVIKDQLDLENSLLGVNQQEEAMLFKNQMVTGVNTAFDVVKLKQALDFQTERLTGIKKRQLLINAEIAGLTAELQKYNMQIDALNSGNTEASGNILVTVSSRSALPAAFTLNYLVNNASWYPTYDIRAKDVNSPIVIAYKANVTQQSGEDWKNIRLTLSTGNPSVSGIKPELNPYYLNLDVIHQYAGYNNSLSEVVVVDKSLQGRAAGVNVNTVGYGTVPLGVRQVENQTNIEFNIDNPYSVPGDGKEYTVEINQTTINASYQYAVAPKLSTDVFLSAKLTDWSKYNFLPGEANLFFEGTFIGKSRLDAASTDDTLNISLGADKSIVVSRTLLKDLTEKKVLGSNKKITRDWAIAIKNRKSQPVKLLVEDQLPVSQNSAIEVEAQALSAGALDPNTGKVAWNITLKPQEDKKLELKYQVKYPKNQALIIE